jgi:hypothetical protein
MASPAIPCAALVRHIRWRSKTGFGPWSLSNLASSTSGESRANSTHGCGDLPRKPLPRCHGEPKSRRNSPRNRKFESVSLQRRVAQTHWFLGTGAGFRAPWPQDDLRKSTLLEPRYQKFNRAELPVGADAIPRHSRDGSRAARRHAHSASAQPKAVATGFEGQCNSRDLFTGPDCLVAPAMQHAKQPTVALASGG